eukprot:m.74885 g.74885  ORF g.74885 m.74885 type:complete len:76 (+) comp12416_c0_seq6:209-436(+)
MSSRQQERFARRQVQIGAKGTRAEQLKQAFKKVSQTKMYQILKTSLCTHVRVHKQTQTYTHARKMQFTLRIIACL